MAATVYQIPGGDALTLGTANEAQIPGSSFFQAPAIVSAATWKTTLSLVTASIKTVLGLALASIKTNQGLTP